MSDDRRLTEKQLAKRWNISQRTLQIWRRDKVGPPFMVLGKNTVLYREEDVREYENKRLIQTNNKE
jgi:DNA-binding transcriptional MerR regulator